MTAASFHITDLSQLPLVLTIDDIATLYRRAKSTIRRHLQRQQFSPPPFDGPPYRWLRADIERDLARRAAPAPRRGRADRPRRRPRR